MQQVVHKAETRGEANHGWLHSYHSFSFANFHNPDRMNFGALRVLNDDQVHPGKGFGSHPHDNMEIISIPLEGDLEHKDSMGNEAVIREGEVQVMSAGTGIFHSELNRNHDKDVKFLQIWVVPNKRDIAPRYDQISLKDIAVDNKFFQILSPSKEDQGVWIQQNAWFSLGNFEEGFSDTYTLKDKANGVYIFIVEGEITVNGENFTKRDGIGLWNTETFSITATTDARVLLIEVPMFVQN